MANRRKPKEMLSGSQIQTPYTHIFPFPSCYSYPHMNIVARNDWARFKSGVSPFPLFLLATIAAARSLLGPCLATFTYFTSHFVSHIRAHRSWLAVAWRRTCDGFCGGAGSSTHRCVMTVRRSQKPHRQTQRARVGQSVWHRVGCGVKTGR